MNIYASTNSFASNIHNSIPVAVFPHVLDGSKLISLISFIVPGVSGAAAVIMPVILLNIRYIHIFAFQQYQ